MAPPSISDHYGNEEAINYGYGYEDYGYGDAAPAPKAKATRRSSLKTSENYVPRRRNSISYRGEMKVMLPDERVVKRRTSIGFTTQDEVKEVEPIASLAHDPQALWTTEDEYVQCQEEAQSVIEFVRLVGCPNKLSKMKICTRGFEKYVDDSYVEDRWNSQDAVLDLQDSQRRTGRYCDEKIGKAYARTTKDSLAKARDAARRDYLEVKQDHKLIRSMMYRMTRRGSM